MRRGDNPHVNVRRTSVLVDTFGILRTWSDDEKALRSTPYVKFSNELGMDMGGPRRYHNDIEFGKFLQWTPLNRISRLVDTKRQGITPYFRCVNMYRLIESRALFSRIRHTKKNTL